MWFGQQQCGAFVSYKVPRKIRFPKNILYRLNNQEGVLTAAAGVTLAILKDHFYSVIHIFPHRKQIQLILL